MDATGLPSDDTAEMLRDSLRGFLEAHWAASVKGGPSADDISAIWRKLIGQGVATLGVQPRRRRPSRNPGGDGGTWPCRMSGADVVRRAGQSCALGLTGRCRGGTARKAARRHGGGRILLRRPRSGCRRGLDLHRWSARNRACFASSRRPAPRIFWWPSMHPALPSSNWMLPASSFCRRAPWAPGGSARCG